MSTQSAELKRSLNPLMLWGLGVGYVISGMYFGWNLGLEKGGTLGLAIATFFIIIMYIAFTLSYTELACAIPKAGGGFDYAKRALGRDWGFITGMAQNIEFTFAPPAIAIAIGSYFNLSFPTIPILSVAIFVYIVFTALNIYGVKAAALFELVITVLAVGELLLFAGITLPHLQVSNLSHNAFPNGWSGAFAAIPFAIWFFLAIEGVANLAEEAEDPKRTIKWAFGSAMITLIVLCILVFISSVGVAGWEAIVYKPDGSASDSPLPLAMNKLVGSSHWLYHLLITVGLFGLIASFHGIILAGGRATYEFGKVGFAPTLLGKISGRFNTPAYALLFNMCVGIIALLTGKTSEIITISVFGALTLYILSMVAMMRLREKEPLLERPYKVKAYPLMPILALVIAIISIISMTIYNAKLAIIYFGLLFFSWLIFKLLNIKNQEI